MARKVQASSILLTGAYGYIGSHFMVSLYRWLQEEYNNEDKEFKIVIIDNLSNSCLKMGELMTSILQQKYPQTKKFFEFHQIDVLDEGKLNDLFNNKKQKNEPIQYIVHFAAKKAVGESCKVPLDYFKTNVNGSMNIFNAMIKYDCRNFIFSSTASIYGNNKYCSETNKNDPQNPYARTKATVEYVMQSLVQGYPQLNLLALRYFNPGGAHETGIIGDYPIYPNNLFPMIEQVVIGNRQKLFVFGNDYDTKDGTGSRDYIHINDLVDGHIAAFKKIEELKGYNIINLGTGTGYTVLDIIQTYQKVNNIKIPHELAGRRDGDVDQVVAKVDKAYEILGWKSKYNLEQICQSSYNFIQKNPKGIN